MESQPTHEHRPHQRRFPRRPIDWIEGITAWLLIACGIVAIVVSVVLGATAYRSVAERARTEAADRIPAQAILLRNTDPAPDPQSPSSASTMAPIRWIGRDGVERTGEALVRGTHEAGEQVPIWMDKSSGIVPPPVGIEDAYLSGVMSGLLVFAGIVGALASLWWVVRRWVFARACIAWEREWVLVEPAWTGRSDKR